MGVVNQAELGETVRVNGRDQVFSSALSQNFFTNTESTKELIN